MEPQMIQIPKFNKNMMRQDAVSFVIGRRQTGKTFLAKNLVFGKSRTIVMVASGQDMAEYKNTTTLIHAGYSEDVIENVITLQRRPTDRINIILDDCVYNTHSRVLQTILTSGRHLRLATILCMSHPFQIQPALRANVDYVFILRETDISNRKRLYEQYGGMFPFFNDFCSVLDRCAHYECLVIDTHQNKVFWYKADTIHLKIQQIFGNPEFASQLRILGKNKRIKSELIFKIGLKNAPTPES